MFSRIVPGATAFFFKKQATTTTFMTQQIPLCESDVVQNAQTPDSLNGIPVSLHNAKNEFPESAAKVCLHNMNQHEDLLTMTVTENNVQIKEHPQLEDCYFVRKEIGK